MAAPAHAQVLTGIQKAAILLISIGDQASAELLKRLGDDEVQAVTAAIASLPAISREQAEEVLEEFRLATSHSGQGHGGVDFAGQPGDSVRAANRGVVALVDNFFLAGNVVYIDHGGGVVTGYFHLTQALVAVGDTVQRGQEIGLVGATGRVTGPHLHWSARYGALTVNPIDLLTVAGW